MAAPAATAPTGGGTGRRGSCPAHRLAQVAVGGGDDARRGHAALRLAHALILAVLQHAQQLRLHLQRQLADLVEEKRAVVRILEVAGLRRGGAGEGALGVAEERRLDQRRRERRAVEREVGRAARADSRCRLCATSSLPLPDSPSISTGNGEAANCAIWLRSRCDRRACADELGRGRRRARRPRRSSIRLSIAGSAGLAMNSHAPSARAWRALAASFCPESTKILIFGECASRSAMSLKALLGRVRRRRQPEVDQRKARGARELAQQRHRAVPASRPPARRSLPQRERQRVGDQRIVVDHQQRRLTAHGCTS
jgi:hypothetical protein